MAKNAVPAIDVNSGKQVRISRPPRHFAYFDKQGLAWMSPHADNRLTEDEKVRREQAKEERKEAYQERLAASRAKKAADARTRAAKARKKAQDLADEAEALEKDF